MALDRDKAETKLNHLLKEAKDKYQQQIEYATSQLNHLNGIHGNLRSDLEAFLGGADDATLDRLLLKAEIAGIDSSEVKSFISTNKDKVTDFYTIGYMVDGRSMVPFGWTNMLDHITSFINEKIDRGIYLSREYDFNIIERVRDALIDDSEHNYTPNMKNEYISAITMLDVYLAQSRKRQAKNQKVVFISR